MAEGGDAVENDGRVPNATQYTTDYSDWMAKLPQVLHDVPLTQIAIPGEYH